MDEKQEDMWPQDFGAVNTETPPSLLNKQASLLGPKTNNLVEAGVTTQADGSKFKYVFRLFAPSLDYRYTLFILVHDINIYPIYVLSGEWDKPQIDSFAELKDFVRRQLSSEKTQKIINNLISLSQ